MGRIAALAVAGLLMVFLSAGCGGGRDPQLLGRMPSGLDFYLTVSQEEAGVAGILESLDDAGLRTSPEWSAAAASLGMDPLSWDDWVSSMGLDPTDEIGLAGYMGGDVPSALVVFLPVSDSNRLEAFVSAIPGDAPLQLRSWREGWWAMYASEVPQQLEMIVEEVEGGRTLADDEDFQRLWSGVSRRQASVYAYLRMPAREELETLLLAAGAEGTVASASIAMVPSDPAAAEGLEVMRRGPAGSVPGLPDDVDMVLRSTVDMDRVTEMAEGQLPPDAQQGLAMMGFDSVEDMLAMFSGDSWMAVDLSGSNVRGLAVVGLRDASAMEGLLSRVSGFAAMGGQEIGTVSGGGVTGYSIPMAGSGGAWPLEIGVAEGALYVLYGYSLSDAGGWSAPDEEDALGVDHGAPVFAFGDLRGLRRHLPGGAGDILPEAGGIAMSISSDGEALVVEGALETGSSTPLAAIAAAAYSALAPKMEADAPGREGVN